MSEWPDWLETIQKAIGTHITVVEACTIASVDTQPIEARTIGTLSHTHDTTVDQGSLVGWIGSDCAAQPCDSIGVRESTFHVQSRLSSDVAARFSWKPSGGVWKAINAIVASGSLHHIALQLPPRRSHADTHAA